MMPNKKKRTRTPKRYYVDNNKLYDALVDYRKQLAEAESLGEERPRASEYIGDCIVKIATNFSFFHKFINYSYRDDMILDAIENCIVYVHRFDPDKSKYPFAYFTKICFRAFIRRIGKEQKQSKLQARLLENLDMESIITQSHDDRNYLNAILQYVNGNSDIASEVVDGAYAHADRLESRTQRSEEISSSMHDNAHERFVREDESHRNSP